MDHVLLEGDGPDLMETFREAGTDLPPFLGLPALLIFLQAAHGLAIAGQGTIVTNRKLVGEAFEETSESNRSDTIDQ